MSQERSLNIWAKIGIIVLILVASGGVAGVLIASKEEPKKKDRDDQGVLVRVSEAQEKERQLRVEAQGNVIAARSVAIQSQVTGEVVFVSDDLVPGGIVEKGDVLVRIEPADYRLAVEEARTSVRQAEAQLALEQGQQRVAEKEWALFKDEFDEEDETNALALRQPQLDSARVAVDAAQSRLDRAELNLRRTTIRAPFNGVVLADNVDIGQFVTSQTQMARLADSDVAWVQASLPVEQLGDIAIPGVNAEEGAKATISLQTGRSELTWRGRVIRLYGELDPQGRMARVLLEVPQSIGPDSDGEIPLLLGSYVDVAFDARESARLVEIRREAVRDGDEVFVFADGKLEIRSIEIAWRRRDTVLVRDGLSAGDKVITSQIAAPVEGMALRTDTTSQGDEGATTAKAPESTDE